jgi:hypothetical protein
MSTYAPAFAKVWETYIMSLKDKEIKTLCQKRVNTIIDVTPEHLIRRSSNNGEPRSIPFYAFEKCYLHIIQDGHLTREQINRNIYTRRASAIMAAVLSKIPFFDVIKSPKVTLVLNKNKMTKCIEEHLC